MKTEHQRVWEVYVPVRLLFGYYLLEIVTLSISLKVNHLFLRTFMCKIYETKFKTVGPIFILSLYLDDSLKGTVFVLPFMKEDY